MTAGDLAKVKLQGLRKLHNRQLDLDRGTEPKLLSARCLGMKVSRDFIDVFLEAPLKAPPKTLTNRILTEELPDQRNDVELKRDGKLLGPRIQFNTSEIRKALRW